MAMRQCADDLQRLGARRHNHAALEQGAQSLDPLARPIGQVQQGPLLDLAILAVGLAQQDGRRRIAVRDALDVHGFDNATPKPPYLDKNSYLHGYIGRRQTTYSYVKSNPCS